jgi:hypothetical protein
MTEYEPFKDFPSPSDWGFTDKAMQWKRDNEQKIKIALQAKQAMKEFPIPPPVFCTDPDEGLTAEAHDWLCDDFTKWLQKWCTDCKEI